MSQTLYTFYSIGSSLPAFQVAASSTLQIPNGISLSQYTITTQSANYDGLPSFNDFFFGTGIDGNVTVDGATTTLSRDMYYNSLTVGISGTIKTNGFRIFCKEYLKNDGLVDNSANGQTAGAGNVYGNGIAGADSSDVNGEDAAGATNSYGGNGGNGGGSNFSTGGLGGVTGNPFSYKGGSNLYQNAINWIQAKVATTNESFQGGSGGGGGGGGSNGEGGGGTGGAGGGGGGIIVCAAKNIYGQGFFRSAGGNGLDGNGGDIGGGGGGGGGGVIVLISLNNTESINCSAIGGNGGNPCLADGSVGDPGNDGTISRIYGFG